MACSAVGRAKPMLGGPSDMLVALLGAATENEGPESLGHTAGSAGDSLWRFFGGGRLGWNGVLTCCLRMCGAVLPWHQWSNTGPACASFCRSIRRRSSGTRGGRTGRWGGVSAAGRFVGLQASSWRLWLIGGTLARAHGGTKGADPKGWLGPQVDTGYQTPFWKRQGWIRAAPWCRNP
jgi:hypothetical protein